MIYLLVYGAGVSVGCVSGSVGGVPGARWKLII